MPQNYHFFNQSQHFISLFFKLFFYLFVFDLLCTVVVFLSNSCSVCFVNVEPFYSQPINLLVYSEQLSHIHGCMHTHA